MQDVWLHCFEAELTNLKLKTRPKQHLGSLPIDKALLGSAYTRQFKLTLTDK